MLRIDGHAYSPTILQRILHMAAVSSSFDQAEVSLRVVGELEISDRQINKLAKEMGTDRLFVSVIGLMMVVIGILLS